ncbi:MAG TPA: hypothetical protein VHM02_06675, partial [Thermoanaerobaculia bacterium]|nr:hypothetical protein [Thermoanaerobaculia bacterium]
MGGRRQQSAGALAPIAFGPYTTGPLRDRGTLSASRGDDDFGAGFSWRPFGFTLTTPDGEIAAACHAFRLGAHLRGVEVEPPDSSLPALLCGFEDAAGEEVGTLRLELRRGRDYVGTLTAAGLDRPLAVRSIHQVEGSRLPWEAPAGYEIARVGGAIAAVETIGRGAVRFAPEVGPELADRLA